MAGPWKRVVIVVVVAVVDLLALPSEDAEDVVGAEVYEGDIDGAGTGAPAVGGVEEDVADELVVSGVRRGVDAEPVQIRRRVDAGPPHGDGAVGPGEGRRGHGEGNAGEGRGNVTGEEDEEAIKDTRGFVGNHWRLVEDGDRTSCFLVVGINREQRKRSGEPKRS